MNAPLRARKVPRALPPSDQDRPPSSPRSRSRFLLYYVVPLIVFAGIAVGVLIGHMLFGTGIVGLAIFLVSTFLAIAFAVLAVVDWLRFWRDAWARI